MNFNMDEWNVIKKEDGTEYLERKDVAAIRQRVAESAADNLEEFAFMHNQFTEHIDEVYNMEMYFGDQSLSKLLEHSKFVSEQTQQYLDVLRGLDFEEDEEE